MKLIFTFFILLTYGLVFSQDNHIVVRFNPTFNNTNLELNKNYSYKNDSLKITTLKFYISNIQFFKNTVLVDAINKKHHLINLEDTNSLLILHTKSNNMPYNKIIFNIGIDSITNVSGAIGGDLDPTNGMYWAWQSGYINFKLEGISKICPSKDKLFMFHIGGYQYPYNCTKKLEFVINNTKEIICNINISQLLNTVALNELYVIMSPSSKAILMTTKIANAITIAK